MSVRDHFILKHWYKYKYRHDLVACNYKIFRSILRKWDKTLAGIHVIDNKTWSEIERGVKRITDQSFPIRTVLLKFKGCRTDIIKNIILSEYRLFRYDKKKVKKKNHTCTCNKTILSLKVTWSRF